MSFRTCGFAAAVVLSLYPQIAAANVSVQYTLIPVGGNVYRYVYSITNDGSLPGGAPIKLFDVFYDPTLFSSLSVVTSQYNSSLNAQWAQNIYPPLPGVCGTATAAACIDFDSAGGAGVGIPAGTTVSGFAVQFTWLGSGTPGSQPFFQVYDPTTTPVKLLQTGSTFSAATVPVSSNFSLLLMGVGLALAATYQMRESRRRARFESGVRS